jgi:uncharacterized surface protein with fasciclin (FAS1) repeats
MSISKIFQRLSAISLSLVFVFSVIFSVQAQAQATQNIVEIASGNSNTSTLVDAVQAAGLVDTLSGPGPFTVFAPTNDAFSELGDTLNVLLLPENQQLLADILTYHVVSGDVPSSQAVTLDSATSVQGGTIELSTSGNNLFLNGTAQVTTADVEASNGRIHIIDEVILSDELNQRVQQAVANAGETDDSTAPQEMHTTPRSGGYDLVGQIMLAVFGLVSLGAIFLSLKPIKE